MTDLSVRLELAAVRDCPEVGDHDDILRTIARIGSDCYRLDADAILAGLIAREALGSTAFGKSIAIPHTKLAELDHCVGIFLRLAEPVSFNAHDGKPVDLIFALLSSQKAGVEHLKALASVSRFLRDENMVAKLRGASSQDALYALLNKQREQQAA
ncbi:MAG: PTS transporter subunit EIIA [Sphingomonadales bacterium]|nr:PTS transporter subunit EIIA [Sphingomonadales bacterium]PIX64777.1 MAG: PTS lactose transporter subunit IIC [Sphingomonadales bacterium CG_4_10_14_3_um_filter_58_15]NCO48191.1 PTS transporter subunit EIIA [Sphingomonadales bacterium]NCO99780.1 PTS transporter subunit EIIA [Sphingomonadales bacterium]NCP28168.1 PTS transporter subunit EIIA [Sphingomonadales bacterium]